jgi:hypothetical protein
MYVYINDYIRGCFALDVSKCICLFYLPFDWKYIQRGMPMVCKHHHVCIIIMSYIHIHVYINMYIYIYIYICTSDLNRSFHIHLYIYI